MNLSRLGQSATLNSNITNHNGTTYHNYGTQVNPDSRKEDEILKLSFDCSTYSDFYDFTYLAKSSLNFGELKNIVYVQLDFQVQRQDIVFKCNLIQISDDKIVKDLYPSLRFFENKIFVHLLELLKTATDRKINENSDKQIFNDSGISSSRTSAEPDNFLLKNLANCLDYPNTDSRYTLSKSDYFE